MKYLATVNKRVRYVKVYRIIKRANQSTNALSAAFEKIVNKYVLKRKNVEEV
ncbi:MAG: hypothetical protein KGH59_04460 [Candidatus Micrarchaeota archaeon]|nr:hypothetical protein [Candidatus Micrarchaeota archaeon]MDE1805004.1 hypothetical protein [Candidatus Micrarchaeota archaeon]MDE1846781.1 hypothetical protein [Candidatus Micrarchaeota archaeon]